MPEPIDAPTTVVYIHGAGPQAGKDLVQLFPWAAR